MNCGAVVTMHGEKNGEDFDGENVGSGENDRHDGSFQKERRPLFQGLLEYRYVVEVYSCYWTSC